MYHAFIISVIVVTRTSIIFIEYFLWHLITVNHSGKNLSMFNLFPACYIVKMGTGPYMSHEINLLGFWFITAWHGGEEAGSNVLTCYDILGPFLSILDKHVWRWASLTLVFLPAIQHAYEVFNLQWTESSSSSISLRHVNASPVVLATNTELHDSITEAMGMVKK